MRYEFDCPPYGPAMIEAFDKSEMDPNITIEYGAVNHVKTVKYRVAQDFELTIPPTATDPAAWASRVAITQLLRDGPPERALEHRELDVANLTPWTGELNGPV